MKIQLFLSVVICARNRSAFLPSILSNVERMLNLIVADYEIIIVDNASTDETLVTLKELTGAEGRRNLQVYALTKEVDSDTASWVGLENALGDYVAVVDPFVDEISVLPDLLAKAVGGADVVFASNMQKAPQTFAYRTCFSLFNMLYKSFNGVHLGNEAPQYRLLSKRVVNFLLQHPMPALSYRHLPASGGFAKAYLTYSAPPKPSAPKRLGEGIDRGIRLLVSTTRAPMRLVTILSIFGAAANVLYSIYVVAVGLLKDDIAPGWVSLSLQQSGMFFLISLVLMVLGEYILQMASLSNEGPLYHVGQEFTSARMTRHEKLNVEEAAASQPLTSFDKSAA